MKDQAFPKVLALHFCDIPSSLSAQHGITCIDFRDTQEKDRFVHQIDRVVKLQQERSVRLRGRADSGNNTAKRKPTELVSAA